MSRMQGSNDSERHVLSRLRCKEITEQEWENWHPEGEQSLDDVARAIRPRIAEHAFELAAVNGIGAISQSIVRDPSVRLYVESARKHIFGAKHAPFSSLEDAWDWIWSEVDSEEGKKYQDVWSRFATKVERACKKLKTFDSRLEAHFAKGEGPYKLTAKDNKFLEEIILAIDPADMNPLAGLVYTKYKKELHYARPKYASNEVSELFMQSDSRILSNLNQPISDSETRALLHSLVRRGEPKDSKEPMTYAEWMQRTGYFGMPHDHVMFASPGSRIVGENDATVPACTEKLMLLAIESLWISQRLVKCWSQGQTAAHILMGMTPELPRMRIWIEELPGGGKRSFIELTGGLNQREMWELYSAIRHHTGAAHKKSLTPSDVALCDFVEETPGQTWAKRLQLWNDQNPSRQFRQTSGLINAYHRAKSRLTRP